MPSRTRIGHDGGGNHPRRDRQQGRSRRGRHPERAFGPVVPSADDRRFGSVAAVIRRHSSTRRRSGTAVSGHLWDSWPGRLLLLAIAIGVVLMHHVVGAHQHSAPDVPPSDASAQSLVARTAPPAAGHHHGTDAMARANAVDQHRVIPAGMSATGSAALLHQHPDENGHDHAGALLHVCLAALVGAAVVLLVLVLVARWWRTPPVRLGRGVVPTTAPRAPPAPARLAELQVLRL
jgi:Family of unknown function (DUF6153)